VHPPHERQRAQRGHRHRAGEVVGGGGERIHRGAPPQRVPAPGRPGPQHQRGGERLRRGEAGEHEPGEPAERGDEPQPFQRARALAGGDPAADHGHLHRAEEQQRAGAGRQPQVGERERPGVQEERRRGRPAPAPGDLRPPERRHLFHRGRSPGASGLCPPARRHPFHRGRAPGASRLRPPEPQQREQHRRPGGQPDQRVRGGVDLSGAQGRAREQRVAREAAERRDRQRGQRTSCDAVSHRPRTLREARKETVARGSVTQ